jgi:hypothetical protein
MVASIRGGQASRGQCQKLTHGGASPRARAGGSFRGRCVCAPGPPSLEAALGRDRGAPPAPQRSALGACRRGAAGGRVEAGGEIIDHRDEDEVARRRVDGLVGLVAGFGASEAAGERVGHEATSGRRSGVGPRRRPSPGCGSRKRPSGAVASKDRPTGGERAALPTRRKRLESVTRAAQRGKAAFVGVRDDREAARVVRACRREVPGVLDGCSPCRVGFDGRQRAHILTPPSSRPARPAG